MTKLPMEGHMATILPFPRIRDHAFVARQASWLAELPPSTAEKQLARQLQVQRETMVKRGITFDLVEQHVREIEAVIRDAMWRLVRLPGGAA